jgi:hypothetical protein
MKREIAGGRAVLILGDSLDLLRTGKLPQWDALVSDPPYGIVYLLCHFTAEQVLEADRCSDLESLALAGSYDAWRAARPAGARK